jgi:response regulator RpfG family c-di-GMP phosphodiesterase
MATGPEHKPSGMPTVMLIDDEPLILETLAPELQGSFKLYLASSADEGDLLLAARHYDAIVCDHMLPGEQGLDFLMRVSEMVPSTKRILMTGYTNPEFVSRSMAIAGLSACLVKPLKASQIAVAINAALEA